MRELVGMWGRTALGCALITLAACGGSSKSDPGTSTPDASPITGETDDAGTGQNPMGRPDAGKPPPMKDAAVTSTPDTGTGMDSDAGDAGSGNGCAAGETLDACGVCGGDGSSCMNPIAGSYAVRTVIYARQKARLLDQTLDTVSKGTLISLATIGKDGKVEEHYCALEITNEDGIFSWSRPSGTQKIPASVAMLESQGDRFVRPTSADQTYVSWSPDNQPADCTPGSTHSSGCKCFAPDAIPTDPADCRVTDLDEDGKPGGKLFVSANRPEDLSTDEGLVQLQIAATKAIEWRLPKVAQDKLVGEVSGGIEQSELSREGDPALIDLFGRIGNSVCPGEYGHVELVRGNFTCEQLVAGRVANPDTYGIFDAELDGTRPELEACPDPDLHCQRGLDACNVCGGDGTSCAGCDGVPNSGKLADVCGVCGGDGTSCLGCDGVANSGKVNDACGVCGGDGASCAGCDGVPNSGKVKDACGVCGGNGSSCAGCDGVPNSGKVKDACGVCGGNGSSCAGCDGVPNSGKVRDVCGVCGGDGKSCLGCDGVPNSGKLLDRCNVCGGDGKSCLGCDGVPFSGKVLDACGVCGGPGPDACGDCGGNGSGCAGCDGVPNSGKVFDACGVCGGNGSSCAGCDGIPNSGKVLDACGVCGGNGQSCAGCDGVPNSGKVDDACGVCGGDSSSCAGCDGVPNSGKVVDKCGVCGGNNACLGCDGVPNSGKVKDACGVCGGDGSSCAQSPLVGTYAVRSILFTKAKSGNTTNGSKAINYSLVTITQNGDGTLKLTDKSCYSETQSLSGTTVYSWSKPSWLAAIPAVERTLTKNSDGSYTRVGAWAELGWKSANQPKSCTSSATPAGTDWKASWGSTCKCTSPADALPPFSKSTPYDCRVVDTDNDGYPGVSGFASTSPPSNPESDAGGLSWARLMVASKSYNTWNIVPSADGKHTATVSDSSVPAVVGCVGGGFLSACTQVNSNPVSTFCPQQYNKAWFVRSTANTDSCAEIVANRSTLFSSANDGSLPNDTVCPPPK